MISSKLNISSRSRTDTLLVRTTGTIAMTVAVLLGLVLLLLFKEAWPVLRDGNWRLFFSGTEWFPANREYDLIDMLFATLAASLGALSLAMPLGVASAIFSRFYAPVWLVKPLRRVMVLLAGVPSVVYGLWGLTVVVPLIARWEPPGTSLLCAILILALMVLPTVALTSESALAAVSTSNLHGAAALGLSRKTTVLEVALPEARSGILTGGLLAAMRAVGETMAVLMVAGNVVQMPTRLFDPVRVLTANIALEMPYAAGEHRAALFASGLSLMLIVTVLAGWAARMRSKSHA